MSVSHAIQIRPATLADYEQIVAVWRESGVHHDARESPAAFAAQLAAFPDTYLVATEGTRIVGVVLGTHDLRKGWINRLGVLPDYQRRGIARRLLAACEAALRARGLALITALVEQGNDRSAALFRCAGYRDDLHVHYFRKDATGGAAH